MNNTYFNSQARTFFALISLFILVSSCEENFPVEIEGTDTLSISPSIDSVRAVYNDITQRFFLEALLSDPQGLLNIDAVKFVAIKVGRTDSLSGTLNDSAVNGDIIRGDGRYSALLSLSLTNAGTGSFRFIISANDLDSNKAEEREIIFDIMNYPPNVTLFSVTDSVAVGDSIFIEVTVTDLNGLSDIRKVGYDIFRNSDSTLIQDDSFVMRDDGLFGDRTSGDGIYSVIQPTNPTGDTGVFDFLITAEDFAGLKSDALKVKVTLTN
ncbi:MAG: hypothetical protein IIC40_02985 [Candidatus Marinimicrobia bacterium]|nr:hypothetical protein [Candidatus Neomarinimicrobiota bacterium]